MFRLQINQHLAGGVPFSSTTTPSSSSRRTSGNSIVQFPTTSASISPRIDFFQKHHHWRCQKGDYRFQSSRCYSSLGGGGRPPDASLRRNEGDQFLQAFLLVSETVRHYYSRKQGFLEETKWNSSATPFSLQSKVSGSDSNFISHEFLRRFHSPTIFLKIACEGDMLLPIVVGEFALERLMNSLRNDKKEACPNQIQFVKNLMGTLGYEVKKVCITKRVANTYYAQIFLGKTTEEAKISIDSRPSDAIQVANMFEAPIYVSKEIVFKDAIRIVYGSRRRHASKTVYDVLLDSATEGPDVLAEELDLVRKMNEAVMAERFKEAAIWRDKLNKLRRPRNEC